MYTISTKSCALDEIKHEEGKKNKLKGKLEGKEPKTDVERLSALICLDNDELDIHRKQLNSKTVTLSWS